MRDRLQVSIDQLAHKIENEIQQGNEPSVSWLHKEERYKALLDQIEARIAELAKAAGQPVTRYQEEVVKQAAEHSQLMTEAALAGAERKTVRAVMKDWNVLSVDDTEHMIGRAADGKPLGDLLEEIAPQARTRAAQILTDGVALGHNPRKIASELQNVSDEALRRLLTIARTEALGAQRSATLAAYKANRKIVKGWIWYAQLDDRTCEACCAMAGQEMGFGELDGHPNCRCCLVPQTRSWDELGLGDLGIPETSPAASIETGAEWFARQPESTKLAILGPTKLELLEAGKIDWPDMVKRTRNKRWGSMRRPATIAEAEANAAKR